MNPYILQGQPMQDVSGLQPVFQNFGQQQANQQMALAQQNQLVNQAGQTQGNGGMNPLAMAQMLRNKDPKAQNGAFLGDRAFAYLGTQNTPEMQAEINKLGSNTWNPISDYNTGANGWGSYGE